MRPNLRTIWIDVLLAVVLTTLLLATQIGYYADRLRWFDYVLLVLTSAPVALRHQFPVLTLCTMAGAELTYALAGGVLNNVGLSLLVGMFSVGNLRRIRTAATVWLLATVAVVVSARVSGSSAQSWPEAVQAAVAFFCVWMLGEGSKRWSQRAARLARQAAQAVADERVRIARELHDIVAHHMSVISLQAGLARYVIDTDPPTARAAIATVGDSSREALGELRRLLDVLRVEQDNEPADGYRQPGLSSLDDLVERTRSAGLPVKVVTTGTPHELPAGPDLCAYRVAQESLTNVLKHAGPAAAKVELDYSERALTLTVTDNGQAKPASSPNSHGIRGMRERAELYGGVLTAGPMATGGFRVRLRLPVNKERA
ncbi:sensor histidine kinase [Amycolatopsis pithecellobii]|uniref:histidine kinase n=1 Tax=Amycolatopsis pithecellobii TaxID=664692 RepID=A0A6N7ZA13_9PSEU|nr:sensor histidine kinase [Amycolatopsis pithecellobii]MTD58573.1 sensor histidine kinase [Amycolatopsis pithecellobii]